MKSHFQAFLLISLEKILVWTLVYVPHFKGLGLKNLQYEIGICEKILNKVTMTTFEISKINTEISINSFILIVGSCTEVPSHNKMPPHSKNNMSPLQKGKMWQKTRTKTREKNDAQVYAI